MGTYTVGENIIATTKMLPSNHTFYNIASNCRILNDCTYTVGENIIATTKMLPSNHTFYNIANICRILNECMK